MVAENLDHNVDQSRRRSSRNRKLTAKGEAYSLEIEESTQQKASVSERVVVELLPNETVLIDSDEDIAEEKKDENKEKVVENLEEKIEQLSLDETVEENQDKTNLQKETEKDIQRKEKVNEYGKEGNGYESEQEKIDEDLKEEEIEKNPTNEDNEGKQDNKTTEEEDEGRRETAKDHEELNNCEDLTIVKVAEEMQSLLDGIDILLEEKMDVHSVSCTKNDCHGCEDKERRIMEMTNELKTQGESSQEAATRKCQECKEKNVMLIQNEEDLEKYRNEVSRLKEELNKKNELEERIHQDQLKVKNDRISELSREVNETAQLKVDYKLLMEKLSNLSKSTRALSA